MKRRAALLILSVALMATRVAAVALLELAVNGEVDDLAARVSALEATAGMMRP